MFWYEYVPKLDGDVLELILTCALPCNFSKHSESTSELLDLNNE